MEKDETTVAGDEQPRHDSYIYVGDWEDENWDDWFEIYHDWFEIPIEEEN